MDLYMDVNQFLEILSESLASPAVTVVEGQRVQLETGVHGKTMESNFSFWTAQVKQILQKMKFLETENNKLRSEIHTLSTRVSEVEGDNLSLKKILHESKEQENLHPPNDTLHAEILDLKSKQEEI